MSSLKLLVAILTIIILGPIESIRAQEIEHQWSQRFGEAMLDQAKGVAVDRNSNVFISGIYEDSLNLGGEVLAGGRTYLAKFDPDGNHIWSKSFGTSTINRLIGCVDGSVVVVGEIYETVDYGGGDLVCAGSRDLLLAKFNRAGNHVWSRVFGDTANDRGHNIAVDSLGNIFITGDFWGTVDFGGGALFSAGERDIIVAKFSPNGDHEWSHSFGSFGAQAGLGIDVDVNGDVWATGVFNESMDFGTGLLTSAGSGDIFVAKFDYAGNTLWSERFGAAGNDHGTELAADRHGNVYCTGAFSYTVDFGGGPISTGFPTNIYLLKMNEYGDHVWSSGYGDDSQDDAWGLDVDAHGSVFITGYFIDEIDFGGGVHVGNGMFEAFVAKFSSSGDYLWSMTFGDSASDEVVDIAVDNVGNAFVTGWFQGTVDLGGGALASAGNRDIVCAKFGPVIPCGRPPQALSSGEAGPFAFPIYNYSDNTATYIYWVAGHPTLEFVEDDDMSDGIFPEPFEAQLNGVVTVPPQAVVDVTGWTRPISNAIPGDTASTEFYAFDPIASITDTTFDCHWVIIGDSPVGQQVAPLAPQLILAGYPNPFNPATTLQYTIPESGHVHLAIFDTRGKLVRTLADRNERAGQHNETWNGTDAKDGAVASGVYYARLEFNGVVQTKKLVLLK